jgi:hypothetical protein
VRQSFFAAIRAAGIRRAKTALWASESCRNIIAKPELIMNAACHRTPETYEIGADFLLENT